MALKEPDDLRRKAQEEIKQQPSPDLSHLSSKDLAELADDLHLHQIELELQNAELELALDRYQKLSDAYQILYDFAPVGYFTLNRDGYILKTNLTGAQLLAADRETLVQQKFAAYVAWDSQNQFYLFWRDLLETKQKKACELELKTSDGAHFSGRLESLIIQPDTTAAPQVLAVLSDITPRKQAEKAASQHRGELEQANRRLEEALAELNATQQRIIQQERLAAVGQLAAGVAHDFNNILTIIVGHAELLRMQPTIAGTRNEQSMAVIIEQGERAAHMVRQILDFSRKSMRRPESVELANFMREAAKFLKRTIPESIHVQLALEPGSYWLEADPTQLQQLLANLAVNAPDAMPRGGRLTLSLTSLTLKPDETPLVAEMPAGRWIALTAADTGTGMPPEVLPRVFEPFFTTKEVGEGSGLGLAQVYGIVKQHRGYIDVVSKPGQGTTFSVYFPPLTASLEPVDEKPSIKLPKGQDETILLVEDDPDVLKVLRAMLKHLNYRVITAVHGQAALEIYRTRKDEIALVLTDMVMPELDGLALLQAIKITDPEVKAIVLTGYPLTQQAKSLVSMGKIDWLEKPVKPKQLAEIMRRLLNK